MKKNYETPSVEVVKFQYRDQVVVASGTLCTQKWTGHGSDINGTCDYEVVVKDSGLH